MFTMIILEERLDVTHEFFLLSLVNCLAYSKTCWIEFYKNMEIKKYVNDIKLSQTHCFSCFPPPIPVLFLLFHFFSGVIPDTLLF